MPGYWNRPASGERERREPTYNVGAGHGSHDRDSTQGGGGGGSGYEQRQQAARLDQIRRDAEARAAHQRNLDAAAAARAAEMAAIERRQQAEKVDVWSPSQAIIDKQNKAKKDALDRMKARADAMLAAQELQKKLENQGIQSMSNEELDSMRNLFAAQGAAMDVTGYEAEVNKLKKTALTAYPGSNQQTNALNALDRLTGSQESTDAMLRNQGYDSSGMRTWGDIQGDPGARSAYHGLLSDETPTNVLRLHLPQIGYRNYSSTSGGSRPGGGWGNWGNQGNWGANPYAISGGYGSNMNPTQYGEGFSEARYGTDPMQSWMVGVHSPMYAARGGIMSLRR